MHINLQTKFQLYGSYVIPTVEVELEVILILGDINNFRKTVNSEAIAYKYVDIGIYLYTEQNAMVMSDIYARDGC